MGMDGGMMKYRIRHLRIEGKDRYYAQKKRFIFWETIKTEYDRIYHSDGGVVTKYTAENRVKADKNSKEFGIKDMPA